MDLELEARYGYAPTTASSWFSSCVNVTGKHRLPSLRPQLSNGAKGTLKCSNSQHGKLNTCEYSEPGALLQPTELHGLSVDQGQLQTVVGEC
ncbi:unnamed protein product [Macrosiphum euphorbiae]|uniref:Uncharacterized protein n=1 Tax=Macrosiphum euphorbiae TaxID=13131 RepID=A0AAV0VXP8_9HEMI|nr:unnamed protein product [Macrosiphum euphorbiae]